jgi:hypothetical protein
MPDSAKNTKNDLKCATKPGVSPCGTRCSPAIEGLLIHIQEASFGRARLTQTGRYSVRRHVRSPATDPDVSCWHGRRK